jgi:hypothetical protein
MKRILLLPLLLFFLHFSTAQKLSLGGKIGTILNPNPTTLAQASSPGHGTSAGMFALYETGRSRLGLQVELNFFRWKGKSMQLQLPLLARLGIGKQLHVYAGPYVSHEEVPETEQVSDLAQLDWGFSTGISFHIPLSSKTVLLTDSRINQPIAASGVDDKEASGKQVRAPSKSLSLSVSIGIAHEFKRWKAKQKQKKADRKKKE